MDGFTQIDFSIIAFASDLPNASRGLWITDILFNLFCSAFHAHNACIPIAIILKGEYKFHPGATLCLTCI